MGVPLPAGGLQGPALRTLIERGLRSWAASLRRLGELYDANGNTAKLIEYYQKFTGLWRDADPELQPKVCGRRRASMR